jgi:uncharacterized protein
MKRILISLLVLCAFSEFLFAQDTITIYYGNNWLEVRSKKDASFYRKAFADSKKAWKVEDYYMSNKIQMKGAYTSKKLTTKSGHFVYYHENGIISAEGNFVNDEMDGLWVNFFDTGQKKSAGVYNSGLEEGSWIYWYLNGEKMSEGKYLRGEKTGIWNDFHANGKIKSTATYTQAGHFVFEAFHENGVTSVKGNCIYNKPDGMWTYWNSDGRINLKGNFNYGVREGEWTRFFPDGEMKIFFKNGFKEGNQLGGIVRYEEDTDN